MNYETTFVSAPVPVTVLTIHGEIDGSNYREVISVGKKLYQDGTRNLLIDLGDTSFVSSSGLVALHSIALMVNGGQPLNVDDGWSSLHEMGQGLGELQKHVKLLNVQPRVDRTLEISGFKSSFEIFSGMDAALASFLPEKTAPAGPPAPAAS
jgi:anti-anti-sigma regulatory factor